jgi:hypothetical protein
MRFLSLAYAATAVLLATSMAQAQQLGPATSAGPGRITCKTATMCELGIGTPAKLKFQINVEALSTEDKHRLGGQCAANGKTPCIVTVQGAEMGDPMKIKAAKITWYN